MKRLLALTAAACLIAAPLSFAQTTPTPETPPATTQPAPPPQPATPTPEPAVPPAEPSATMAPPAPAGEARCRTSKDAGEQCSCLSAPTEFGTSAPAASGSHNMCMVPANAASTPEQ
ncbi:MAG TPA: hypothetical protein PLS69_01345 [Terricaulis sp.]|nr:hypothetical protein [Terricaulis sp.]